MNANNIKPVAEGYFDLAMKSRRLEPVKPACSEKHGGYWYCVTHDETFANQFEKDCHIHTGTHTLAWVCYEHGVEVP